MPETPIKTSRYNDWETYFVDMARLVARKSKDDSVQVGVVIVGPSNEIRSTGYNGFPRGIDESDSTRWDRPLKYSFVEHAERNAIYNAARMGVSLLGCTAYMESPPCTDCSRALIQAGISRVVVCVNNPFSERDDWRESIKFALALLTEAGVELVWVDV